MKIMEFDLKWVHMARYELILKLDGALWLTIISKTPLIPKKALEGAKDRKESIKVAMDCSARSHGCGYEVALHLGGSTRAWQASTSMPGRDGRGGRQAMCRYVLGSAVHVEVSMVGFTALAPQATL